MARKKANDVTVRFNKIQQIWSELSFDDWLVFLQEMCPESGFVRHQGHIKGRCIYHEGDNSPSLMVTPSKGIVKCFGGACNKVITNPVKFVSSVLKANYGDSLLFLSRRYGLRAIIPDALVTRYQEYYQHQQDKKAVADAMHKLLLAAYAAPDDVESAYAKPLIEWLKYRKISELEIHSLGVVPPILYLERELGGAESTVAKFARTYLSAVYEGQAWLGALVFFMYDEPDNISRFKLRKPASSDFQWIDDRFDAELSKFRGFYGLNYYKEFFGDAHNPKAKFAVVVEGEFDAISPIEQQARSGEVEFIALATGGKGTQLDRGSVDRLVNLGITTIGIIPDRDKGGVGFVQHILSQSQSDALNFKILQWPDFGDEDANSDDAIKDPDEWINRRSYAEFSRFIRQEDSYQQPHQWVFEQISELMMRIPPDDIRQKSRLAIEWGKYLQNPVECRAFCKNLQKAFELDDVVLFREIQAREEDEDAYIVRIHDTLKQLFYAVGVEAIEHGKRRVELWHKATRTTVYATLNDAKGIESMLSLYYGPLTEFIRVEVGEPTFLIAGEDDAKLSIRARTELYREYVNQAMLRLAKGLLDIHQTVRKAQGIHYISTDANGEMLAYIVNGRDVYRLGMTESYVKAESLEGPQDQNILFRIDADETWLPAVKQASDIEKASMDVYKAYDQVREIINIGWGFKNQALDSQFLAAYVLCLQVMSVFPRQTSIMLCAEASSGKSKFTSGLIGGHEFPKIQLVAASKQLSQYSAAAIRQSTDGSSLALCLDEFEDYGNGESKSVKTRAVLELFRDMIAETPVKVTIGTLSGHAKTYHLRYPVICCAIRPLRDEASLSRFVSIEMAKSADRTDPVNTLMAKFGEKYMRDLRNELSVGLIRHMPALRRIYGEISTEYSAGSGLPPKTASRFREALYPILTMLKFLGLNYKSFAYDFCVSRSEQLAQIATTSENEQIFETILSSPFRIQQGDERVSGRTTIRAMLADTRPQALDEINKTKCGVYYDIQNRWLIVHWIEALQGVLSNSVKFGKEPSPSYLKTISTRSTYCVPPDVVESGRVLIRMKGWMGPGIRPEHCSVFNVSHLIEDVAQHRRSGPASAPPTTAPPTPTPTPLPPVLQRPARRSVLEMLAPQDPNAIQGDDDLKV